MACKGVVFALELGLLSLKEKTAVRHRIESAGGSVCPVIGASVRALITTPAAQAAGGYKIANAQSLSIPIFLVSELDEVLAFPPPPRPTPAPSSRSGFSSASASSALKTPLIVWDEPSSFSDPLPSSEAPTSPSPSLFGDYPSSDYANDLATSSYVDDEAQDSLGNLFDFDLADFDTPTPSARPFTTSRAAPAPSNLYDDDESGAFNLLAMDFDFEAPAPVPARVPRAPKPQPTAKELLDQKMATLAKKMSPSAFKKMSESLTASSASPVASSASGATYRFSATRATARVAKEPKQPLTAPTTPVKKPVSDSMAVRAAKYREITSKTPAPLEFVPLAVSQPTFTPLSFDLKPATVKVNASKRFGLSSSSLAFNDPSPIVFETMRSSSTYSDEGSSLSSQESSSLRSSSDSGVSSGSSSSHTASNPSETASVVDELLRRDGDSNASESIAVEMDAESDFASAASGAAESDSTDSYSGDEEDDDDYDVEEAGVKRNAQFDSQERLDKVKRRRIPRVFVDRHTGVMWQRKSAKSFPAKLLLASESGATTKVFKLNDSQSIELKSGGKAVAKALIKGTPSVPLGAGPSEFETSVAPFNAMSLEEFGPALPRAPRSQVVKEVITGKTNPKFSWVDIVTGKASTTKRVPAMDGQKLFVSGISFADILARGMAREAQFPAYKEECMKKMKEKNEKAMRKLKKKAKKEAKAKATANEEGVIIDAPKVVIPKKLSDGTSLARMKTDAQLLNEIVVWPVKRVEAVIDLRKALITSIFKRFGEISHFTPDWDKGFIHITYKNAQCAKAAHRALKDFDTRVAVIRTLREQHHRTPFIKESVPSPSFYVRWTTCYQRKLDKKSKAVAESKQQAIDSAAAKHASLVAADVSRIKSH